MPELQRYDWGQDERDHTEILPNPIGRYVLAADAERELERLHSEIECHKRNHDAALDQRDALQSRLDAALDALRKTKKALHRMLTVYLEPQGQAEAERIALAALAAADAVFDERDTALGGKS